jgi:pimeloyl-ACP methyl ester carboxylesterase
MGRTSAGPGGTSPSTGPCSKHWLTVTPGIGHVTPLEAPADFAGVVQLALAARVG